MATTFQSSRRAVYRVVYPVRERPTLLADGGGFSVIDCSELGLRYQAADLHLPHMAATVSGVVRFRRGVDVPVIGEVIRVENGTVAIWFRSQAISPGDMMTERKYLDSLSPKGVVSE